MPGVGKGIVIQILNTEVIFSPGRRRLSQSQIEIQACLRTQRGNSKNRSRITVWYDRSVWTQKKNVERQNGIPKEERT